MMFIHKNPEPKYMRKNPHTNQPWQLWDKRPTINKPSKVDSDLFINVLKIEKRKFWLVQFRRNNRNNYYSRAFFNFLST